MRGKTEVGHPLLALTLIKIHVLILNKHQRRGEKQSKMRQRERESYKSVSGLLITDKWEKQSKLREGES